MGNKLKLDGTLTAANVETRMVEGMLLPFGEVGRTSAGKVTASPGTITLPTDPSTVVLNAGHNREHPTGRGVSFTETAEGVRASFRVANTPRGDELLAEASEGLRPGLSVELDGIVIKSGRLLAGRLVAVGAVTEPAFPSALLTAADVGELDSETTSEVRDSLADVLRSLTEVVGKLNQNAVEVTAPNENEDGTNVGASASDALAAKRAQGAGGTKLLGSVSEAAKLMAAAFDGQEMIGNPRELMAALSDVKYDAASTDAGTNSTQAQWLGKLWEGKAYQRRYVPLISHGDLTGMKLKGWRWLVKPKTETWAGNKTPVPSNSPTTESYDVSATRDAGAHDVAREYVDFDSPQFWESYWAAMNESYARNSDNGALSAMLAAATPVTAGAVPPNVGSGWVKLIDGALSFVDLAPASFAVVAIDVYRDLFLTRTQDNLEFFSAALSLEDGTAGNFKVVPSSRLDLGSVLVGASAAATFHELPGASPVRVEGLDMVKGGVNPGLFGYYATAIHDATALALVTEDPEAAARQIEVATIDATGKTI